MSNYRYFECNGCYHFNPEPCLIAISVSNDVRDYTPESCIEDCLRVRWERITKQEYMEKINEQ